MTFVTCDLLLPRLRGSSYNRSCEGRPESHEEGSGATGRRRVRWWRHGHDGDRHGAPRTQPGGGGEIEAPPPAFEDDVEEQAFKEKSVLEKLDREARINVQLIELAANKFEAGELRPIRET